MHGRNSVGWVRLTTRRVITNAVVVGVLAVTILCGVGCGPSAPAAAPGDATPARRVGGAGDLARIPFEQRLGRFISGTPDALVDDLGDALVAEVEDKITGEEVYAVAFELKFEVAVVVLGRSQFDDDRVAVVRPIAYYEPDAVPANVLGRTMLSHLLDRTRATRQAVTAKRTAAAKREAAKATARVEIERLLGKTSRVPTVLAQQKETFADGLDELGALEAGDELEREMRLDRVRVDAHYAAAKRDALRLIEDPDRALAEARSAAATIDAGDGHACERAIALAAEILNRRRAK